ncbi:MAG TPA: DUF2163 domain-containing protein [Caulobacteraceae bacterium]|jgi:hypothetical protein
MRDIPEALSARIASGAAELCHAWLLTRADGTRLGFTDHDRSLVVDGVACSAASGWTAGAADAELSTQPGSGAVTGALDDDAVTEADLDAGSYDGARVECWRVDWREPALRVRLWSGRIARVTRSGARFTAEVEGPLAALDRVAGRVYARGCDAVLGEPRCGVDLDDPRFAGRSCDKRFSTCAGVFENALNFRGFPDIPGDDFLTLYPGAGERHDGGSRR